ncbi:MAG: hypothetical protein ACKVJE_17250 [Pseudomonadales bacterium]
MNHPEKALQLIIEAPSDVDAVLYHVRMLMQHKISLSKGPVVLHLSRQLIPGTYNGDDKDHAAIISNFRPRQSQPAQKFRR